MKRRRDSRHYSYHPFRFRPSMPAGLQYGDNSLKAQTLDSYRPVFMALHAGGCEARACVRAASQRLPEVNHSGDPSMTMERQQP